MNQNMLKLNDDKTERIVFTSKYKQVLYNDLNIMNGGTVMEWASQVWGMGSSLIECCYRYVSMCLISQNGPISH